MKNTKENFQKIEKEIKKLLHKLILAKDENETFKNRIDELENLQTSVNQDINENQKKITEYNSLKKNYNKLRIEKEQLRDRVEQMLKKLESLQIC